MAKIEFSLELKHARDSALQALEAMNDLEFYQVHMRATDLRDRFDRARERLADAQTKLRLFGEGCGLVALQVKESA